MTEAPLPEPGEPDEPDAPLIAAPEHAPRRYPSTLGGLLYLGVLIVTGVGLVIVALGDWRLGITWMGGALMGAALLRLVLRDRDAGMLQVRHRVVDAVLLGGVGGALIFLATNIPNQPV